MLAVHAGRFDEAQVRTLTLTPTLTTPLTLTLTRNRARTRARTLTPIPNPKPSPHPEPNPNQAAIDAARASLHPQLAAHGVESYARVHGSLVRAQANPSPTAHPNSYP